MARLLEPRDGAAAGSVSLRETTTGRVTIREHHSTVDPFRTWQVELAERAERIELGTEVRVYEEITLRRRGVSERHVVQAVLRHTEAEIEVEGVIDGAGAPHGQPTS